MNSGKHMYFMLAGLFILLSCTFVFAATGESSKTLDSANTAYSKGNYGKAIALYEGILNGGQEASEVYFNLGNAYYKTNNIGLAILNYERAKKLKPNDEDIAFNLKLANLKTEDKIDVAPQLFLTEWKNGLVYLMNEKSWSILCIIITVLALILFGIYISSFSKRLKQLGFFGGFTFIVLAMAVFFIAQHSYRLSKNSSDAIIVSPSVTIVSSPGEKSTKLFILHEGTKVGILQEEGDWMEIKIANGNVGWIKKEEMIAI